MKLFVPILFGVMLVGTASGQSSKSKTPPGLEISSWSWTQTYKRADSNTSLSSRTDDIPTKEKRARIRQVSPGEDAFGNSVPISEDPFPETPKAEGERSDEFQYKMVVKNSGVKKILAISWEYVFLDPKNHNEVSRHQFRSKVSIKPGEQRNVTGISRRRPTQVIRVDSATLPDIEQIRIKQVEFSDGSVWAQ